MLSLIGVKCPSRNGSRESRDPCKCGSKCKGFCNTMVYDECAIAKCKRDAPEKLIFIMQWFDREADLLKKFLLIFYTIDATVEIMDMVHKRRFLRRLKVDTVTLPNLFLDNVINIYSRQMTVLECADSCTKQFVELKAQRAFLLVKPDAVKHLGNILMKIESNFRVIRAKMCNMTKNMAEIFYQHYAGQEFYSELVDFMSSAPVVAFVVVGEDSIERLKTLVGKGNPEEARLESPTSLRALFGTTFINNGFQISESPVCVERDISFFFTKCRKDLHKVAKQSILYDCSTCCIIKPHAVRDGLAGRIICDILLEGFKITGLEMLYLDQTHAEEFYEVYRGVLGHYSMMTAALAQGPCYAMEISGCGPETQKLFRDFAGPTDTEIALKLRPNTLRAKYGNDKANNAVHCTDLARDTQLELHYIFGVLQELI